MDFYEINTDYDIEQLMNNFGSFHDSCIKEIVYISGGYVEEDGAMNPFDSEKCVIIVFQSQCAKYRTIEVKFEGVVQMNLVPKPDYYDNIIYDASLIKNNELFYSNLNTKLNLPLELPPINSLPCLLVKLNLDS